MSQSVRGRPLAHVSLPSAAAAVVSLLIAAANVHATARSYIGPDGGNWNTAANWTGGIVPVAGDDVTLGDVKPAGATSVNVAMNYNGPFLPLNSVTLNSSALPGTLIVNQTLSASSMYAITENIGTTIANNTYNQSNGTNNVTTLNIGVSANNNLYNLFGNALLLTSGAENVGINGAGSINQSGGTNTGNGGSTFAITLGVNSGSTGTYNMSGGTLNYNLQVGRNGTGVFNQTGGTVSSPTLKVGGFAGIGAYTLAGGTLTSSGVPAIGTGGTFNLNTGGTLTLTSSLLVNGGTFNFGGGTIAGPSVIANEGTIRLNGRNVSVGKLTGHGTVEGATGSGNGVLTFTGVDTSFNVEQVIFDGNLKDGVGGSLSVVKGGNNPFFIQVLTGTNTYTGTTTVAGGTLYANASGAFSPTSDVILTGSGVLSVGQFTVSIGSINSAAGSGGLGVDGVMSIGTNNVPSTLGTGIYGTGQIKLIAPQQVTFNGGGSFQGTITVAAGSLRSTVVDGLPKAATVNLASAVTFNIGLDETIGALAGVSTGNVNFTANSILSVGGKNADSVYAGGYVGAGTIRKFGAGTLTLGKGAADTLAPNGNANVAFKVDDGVLLLDKADGVNAIAGTLTVNGGVARLNRSNQISNNSDLVLDGGLLDLNGASDAVRNLGGVGGSIALGGGTLNVTQVSASTFGGTITGPGSFVKNGAPDLTLANLAGFGGTLVANSGKLYLSGPINAPALLANAGGTLHATGNIVSLGGGEIRANAGGTVEYEGATVLNGFLRGAGTHAIVTSPTKSTFTGVTTLNSTHVNQNGTALFKNFNNGGTVNNNAALTFDGAANSASGIVNVNAALGVQDFASTGVINIANAATLTNAGANLYLGGGSRTYITAGGTLIAAPGTTVELNGGLLVNNGTIVGAVNVNYGSLLRGTGASGTVTVTDGGRFVPGLAAAPGLAHADDASFAQGAEFDIRLSASTQGSGYDALIVDDAASLSGTLALTTLNGYVPAYGVPHHVLTLPNAAAGVFANVTGVAVDATHWLAVTYASNGVNVTAALPGDANLSGSVDFADLLTLAKHYGLAANQTWSTGDFDGSGSVAFADLLTLAKHYNQTLPANVFPASIAPDWSLAQSLVPEPAGLGVILGIVAALTGRPKRFRHLA